MKPYEAPLPPNETQRLAALRSYGVLDTPAEAAFDDITRIAAAVCGVPTALISFVGDGRQWFKSTVGAGDLHETPRDVSVCAHALLQPDLLEVPDLSADMRFKLNPLVCGEPHLRFYAGAQLKTPDGLALGTVCVLDTVPRRLNDEQRAALVALARQTMTQLELRRALSIADRLQRHRSRLMAVAGHDLKQPLQVITMSVERVRRMIADEKQRQWLGQALEAADRLSTDLDRLAEASDLDEVSELPRPAPLAVDDLLVPLIAGWRQHAERRGVSLRFVPSSARVVSDPVMLRTILGNLIGNAIKYSRNGRVVIGCRRHGNSIAIEVADSGPGIPETERDAVFEAFRQLGPDSEGLGLGLSIVKRTADLLGHGLYLKSAVGRGSRFGVVIPRAG
ncbi:MAG: ATP-binding protein [Variibacter sp.]